ncbi:gastrin/cholecystokinin-like peptide [Cololabis saira]|uniref:gastrin/cholecystokinin-like peptide n=1 Tax=Cololabis saira TaxID=129043 RepID=UPI002AD51706|nr:gastrin/cholecystokinin-like peptide [Cololabis saira]
MSGNTIWVFTLLAALLVSVTASSLERSAAGDGTETNVLQQLLAKQKGSGLTSRLKPVLRAERRAHLSEDEREMMTKQIMQAISEVMNSECMSDRDYQGWVDFGRRDAE